ncbi:hypothetical protein ASPCAL06812 [Aspergillus calidoustus]|uniref:BTB domain-containing protein n=1 Tax=Aspergillus calidoustus TaxID=454130 RepID=A0A0U5G7Z2_ASPCI|nr:hypothetical protein ASPCAL06812 [Aspergillus calidoustus]
MSSSQLKEFLFFEDADTLAFIDPPSYRPTWSLNPNSAQGIGHRVHSQKLLATGSPFFQKLFEPRTQQRNIKRRGAPPEGIKYIIDLTPPLSDEDAVLYLTELSCPQGMRTWANSFSRWNLPLTCISGSDSFAGEEDLGPLPEYSPSRHRAGIVHILQVLEDISPQLDTPCKLWTFFALAKLYEIATMPQINVRVATWVYESTNARLIELHPETTYQLAKGTQCDHLLADSFSILVGEEALLLLRSSDFPGPRKRQATVHGRPQDQLDDDDLQRVQYAGESFLSYILERFADFIGIEMRWLNDSSMYQTALNFVPLNPDEEEVVSELISSLKDFVRATIWAALCPVRATWLPNKLKHDNTGTYPTNDFYHVYDSLDFVERLTTRTFWQQLIDRGLGEDDGELVPESYWGCSVADLCGYKGGPLRNQHEVIIRAVTRKELNRRAARFNEVLRPLDNGPPMELVQDRDEDKKFFGGAEPYFSVYAFVQEADYYMQAYARHMVNSNRPEMQYELTDTLTCLTDKEFKYLPLWAGGCDDGTGGVYAEQPPLAETGGFSAPGPAIHTGSGLSSYAPSTYSFVESTIHGASHRATEGFASEVMSIDSGDMSDAGESVAVGSVSVRPTDNADDLDFTLDSCAEDIDDVSFDTDSDSGDTVIVGNETESSEWDMVPNAPDSSLPIREKRRGENSELRNHQGVKSGNDGTQELPIRRKNF